jgi:hypothetical protein
MPIDARQNDEERERTHSTPKPSDARQNDVEGFTEKYQQPFGDFLARDRNRRGPTPQHSKWMTIDGEQRRDQDEVTEERHRDIQSIAEEWRLNGGTVVIDVENNVSRAEFVHMKWNEPKKLVDPGLVLLKYLSNLRSLHLYNVPATDNGLRHLAKLATLKTLQLAWTNIGDAGLSHLKNLTALETLGLAHTRVTDIGLVHLERMAKLRAVNLDGTDVTDEGLIHLERLTNLEHLSLRSTNVTDEGASRIQAALPGCSIVR